MEEEELYEIEIFVTPKNLYMATMKSNISTQKPLREYKSSEIEEIFEQIVRDILDEMED